MVKSARLDGEDQDLGREIKMLKGTKGTMDTIKTDPHDVEPPILPFRAIPIETPNKSSMNC